MVGYDLRYFKRAVSCYFKLFYGRVIIMIDYIRELIRGIVRIFVRNLLYISGNTITPNSVTIVGTALFFPICILIARGSHVWASILLVFIGLLDTVDGEIARMQKTTSTFGIFLDASTDRIKESLLYLGIVYFFFVQQDVSGVVLAVLALSASMLVSYVKAKGEMILSSSSKRLAPAQLNRIFQDGLMRFEIRITVLIVGLLFNILLAAVAINAIFAWWTAIQRIYLIGKKLK